jgi:hypothetical protein
MLKGFFGPACVFTAEDAGFVRLTRLTGSGGDCLATGTLSSADWRAEPSARADDQLATSFRSWLFIASACLSASPSEWFSSSVGALLISAFLLPHRRRAQVEVM